MIELKKLLSWSYKLHIINNITATNCIWLWLLQMWVTCVGYHATFRPGTICSIASNTFHWALMRVIIDCNILDFKFPFQFKFRYWRFDVLYFEQGLWNAVLPIKGANHISLLMYCQVNTNHCVSNVAVQTIQTNSQFDGLKEI